MPKRFPLIELLVAIVIIALLSFPGEKKTGKEKPGNGMCGLRPPEETPFYPD